MAALIDSSSAYSCASNEGADGRLLTENCERIG
jgi:hypothetical protein